MSAIRVLAYLFGLIFVSIGVLGFMPSYTPNGMLFGMFAVDDLHNLVHIFSGMVALILAMDSVYSRWFFRIFGLVYLVIGIIGLAMPDMMHMMAMNTADHGLHLGLGIVMLLIGIVVK